MAFRASDTARRYCEEMQLQCLPAWGSWKDTGLDLQAADPFMNLRLAAVNDGFLYRYRILQGVFNLCLTQEHVPSAHSPQHALKHGDSLAVDHTSHKPAEGTARAWALHLQEYTAQHPKHWHQLEFSIRLKTTKTLLWNEFLTQNEKFSTLHRDKTTTKTMALYQKLRLLMENCLQIKKKKEGKCI